MPNAFGALDALGDLPKGPEGELANLSPVSPNTGGKSRNRGRVDLVRQTAHRGGKAVTIVRNFTGIGADEKVELAKKIQKACGVGGTVKDGCIEIQGDKREEVKVILIKEGFSPVFAGG